MKSKSSGPSCFCLEVECQQQKRILYSNYLSDCRSGQALVLVFADDNLVDMDWNTVIML